MAKVSYKFLSLWSLEQEEGASGLIHHRVPMPRTLSMSKSKSETAVYCTTLSLKSRVSKKNKSLMEKSKEKENKSGV